MADFTVVDHSREGGRRTAAYMRLGAAFSVSFLLTSVLGATFQQLLCIKPYGTPNFLSRPTARPHFLVDFPVLRVQHASAFGGRLFAEPAAAGGISGQAEHKVTAPPQFTDEQLTARAALMKHQMQAARLTNAEEARILMHYGTGYGVLSTNSIKQPGYPSGSMVLFVADSAGRPAFSFSAMSIHTQDLQKDTRASLVVAVENFKGIEDGRVTFVGDVSPVPDGEVADLKAAYKAKHPTAIWVDFLGDLSWWRMDAIQSIRYVWGFASAGTIEPAEYQAAALDPVAAFAKPILTHMNQDHADANRAIVNHYLPIKADAASILSLDRLGMMMKITKDGGSFKVRVPFIREATDRKAVKEVLVEMTKAAAAAAAEAPEK